MATTYERVILELQIGGRRWLVSDEVGTLTDNGTDLPVLPGLPTDLPAQTLLGLDVAEPPTLALEQLRLPGLASLPTVLPLAATLSALPTPTTTWQQRRPLLTLRADSWTRTPGERLTADLTADTTPEDLATWPPPAAAMTNDTWPLGVASTQRASDGASYPVPFGAPGPYTNSDGTLMATRASPAYNTDPSSTSNRVLVIAADPVAAATVTVVDPSTDVEVTGTVSSSTDGLGRRVAIATVPLASGILPLSDQTYRVIWDNGAGVYGETRNANVWTASDLCLYLLRRSGVRIDRARWRNLQDLLDGYLLAGCIEEATQPWSYLLDAVLPLLPISLLLGPEGWRPVPLLYDFASHEARAHLQVRPGELYEATAQEVVGQLTPTIRLSWAYDSDANAFRETVSCVGDPSKRGSGVETSAYTLAAYSAWLATQGDSIDHTALREPPSYKLETDIIYDRPTACRTLGHLVATRALPAVIRTYPCSPSLTDLEHGDPVLVTDGTNTLARAKATVYSLPMARRGPPTIQLRFAAHPFLPSSL